MRLAFFHAFLASILANVSLTTGSEWLVGATVWTGLYSLLLGLEATR